MANSSSPPAFVIGVLIVGIIVFLVLVLYYPGPTAVHNASTTSVLGGGAPPANATVAVTMQQELNNSAQAGFNIGQSELYSTSASRCSRELISACDNNVPSQFVCVNAQYASQVQLQYQSIYANPEVCPQFLMAGTVSCGIAQDYCVVQRSQVQPMSPSNQTR